MVLFRSIHRKLDLIVGLVTSLAKGTATMNAQEKAALKDATDAITKLTTVEAGVGVIVDTAVGLLKSQNDQIAALLAAAPAGTDPDLIAGLQAIAAAGSATGDDLAAQKDRLSGAVVANTPAAPPVPTGPSSDPTPPAAAPDAPADSSATPSAPVTT